MKMKCSFECSEHYGVLSDSALLAVCRKRQEKMPQKKKEKLTGVLPFQRLQNPPNLITLLRGSKSLQNKGSFFILQKQRY